MADRKTITHQFLDVVSIQDSRFERVYIPALMMLGVLYAGWQVIQNDWFELVAFCIVLALFFALAISRPLQKRVLRQPMNRRHATYLLFLWGYTAVWVNLLKLITVAPSSGKGASSFYVLALMIAALTAMMLRALFMLTPIGYRRFISQIPLWEQVLVALNELIAAALLAAFLGTSIMPRVLQPQIFTLRTDATYALGVLLMLGIYYVGMQLMWVQRWNDWLSQNNVWVLLARIVSPIALVVASMVLWRRFTELAEPRTADLLGDSATDLAVLSLGAVAWLIIFIVTFLVYTGRRGLRQRFLPTALLDRLPPRISRFLRSVSDVDMLLVLGALATIIPGYLILLGDRTGVVGALGGQILERGSALIETYEQALALLFATPFYILVLALLVMYAYALSRPSLSAPDRDELVASLPIGLLIVFIITLYLFAIPFSQVLTEGRLPQLPQDLGRILAFNVLIPLLLLYLHYFLLVRLPYGRGQSRWRERQNTRLLNQQDDTDKRIENLNRELERLDRSWHEAHSPIPDESRLETLFRYVQLNSLRDDLNMQRLQIITARQQLAEVSEAPVSIAVARLPLRVVSLGIPLLIILQIYQWAVVNNGLRDIINTPNLTVDEFFRIILEQANF